MVSVLTSILSLDFANDSRNRAVFESLAYAEHLLAFGHFPEDDRTRDWDLMIHRDIKPGNSGLTWVDIHTEWC